MSLLRVTNLSKAFGGLKAVDSLSFELAEGSILGLIGPNGAGKSTVFNCISGFDSYDEGSVELEGKLLPKGQVRAHLEAGLYRTFQNTELFDEMSVVENISVAISAKQGASYFVALAGELFASSRPRSFEKEALKQLARFDLTDLADKPCSSLSAGQRRIIELVRAQSAKPKVLLLDEPAAGLNASETLKLKEMIRRVRDLETSVILVEHDLKLVMDICDQVLVLDQGKRIAFGPPYIIQKDSAVISAYLGRSAIE